MLRGKIITSKNYFPCLLLARSARAALVKVDTEG